MGLPFRFIGVSTLPPFGSNFILDSVQLQKKKLGVLHQTPYSNARKQCISMLRSHAASMHPSTAVCMSPYNGSPK